MARPVLTVVGAFVGSYFGPIGAQIGGAIGSLIGGALEPDPPDILGPRLEDRRVQISAYGAAIPLAYGTVRLAGNIIWADDLEEVQTESEVDGKGGPTQTTVTYTYYATFAALLCRNRVRGIRRMWADAVLIFDSTLADAAAMDVEFAWYPGTEDQLPDPSMEAVLGVGNVPGYRGYAYIVFNRLPVERFGNRIPSITVELVADGEWQSTSSDVGSESTTAYIDAVQRLDGQIVAFSETTAGLRLRVMDPETGTVTLQVDHDGLAADVRMCYVPPIEEVWIARDGYIERFSASTLAHVGTITVNPAWNSLTMAYEPVNRCVNVHRSSSQVGAQTYTRVSLQGTLVSVPFFGSFGEGMFYCAELVTGGSQVVIGTGGLHQFGVLRTAVVGDTNNVVATQSTLGCRGCWDASRNRYVVVSQTKVWTVTDSLTPTITEYEPDGMFSYSSPIRVQYLGGLDAIAVYQSVVGIMRLSLLDAGTFEVLHETDEYNRHGLTNIFPHRGDPGMVFGVGTYQPYNVRLYSTTVGATVQSLCEQSGLEASDVNVAELSQTLRGYLVAQLAPARSAIEQLAIAFLFECAEQDDILYFRRRGGDIVATVTADECGAGVDEPATHLITKSRAQEADLPAKLYVTAPDPYTDHQPGTQYGERQAKNAGDDEQVTLAVVMSVNEARRLADALLFDRWVSRLSRSWSTTRKFARIVPSDPVMLAGERVRVLSITHEGGVIRWEGVTDDADVVEQLVTGVQGNFPRQVVVIAVPTTWLMLDIALLRDADDEPGAYVAAYGPPPHWRGAVLFTSVDGVGWERVLTMPSPGTSMGVATNALGDFSGGNVFDESNHLNVSLYQGTAESTTRLGVLNGSNPLAIEGEAGWEVLQYRDAVLEDDGTYTLTGLLRGRRGTEYTTGGHAEGDRVVLLSTSGIRNLVIDSSLIGIERAYRAVSIGDTLDNTAEQDETIHAERLVPWSPVQLGGGRNAAGDVLLQWRRRTRVGGEWRDSVDASLGEDSEEFEVDIYTDGTRTTVARTIAALSSPSATYTAAQQTTDFGAPQATVYWAAFQISATVGRGHGANGTT